MKRLCVFVLVAIVSGAWTHGVNNNAVPYEGLVASRARLLTNLDTTNKYIGGRYGLLSPQALTSVRLVIGNYYLFGDTGTGAPMTCTASVEYPAGTYKQETFSTSASATIANNTLVFGDYVTISAGIPANTQFWFWGFCNSTGGVVYFNGQNSFFGEATQASTTSFSDPTLTGIITNNQPTWGFPPVAVLGMTTNASVIVVGDSIGFGVQDIEDGSSTITGYDGKRGIITRSLGSVPFLNLSNASEIAQGWAISHPAKAQMAPKGSELIDEQGTNDIYVNNRTAAQVWSDKQAIWTLARPGQKIYASCLIPDTTSTDGFLTLANQTPVTGNTARVTFNTTGRSGVSGMTGFYDTCIALESSQNSGLTIVTPTPPYTTGIHPTVSGYALVPPSGAIGPVTNP